MVSMASSGAKPSRSFSSKALSKLAESLTFSLERREPGADGEASAKFALFGAEPAAIRDDGVDFTVVGDVTERLRKIPGGLRVCGIALVENGERRGERGVAQIFVKLRELPGREQTFVNDRLRRERTEITTRWQKRFGALAEKREFPLEARDAARGVERRDVELPDFRHRLEGFTTERVRVGWDAAPAEDAEALGVGGGGYSGFGVGRRCGREKCKPQAEYFWQIDALLLRAGAEKFVRERGQQAGAVAAGAIGVDSAAVGQALESRQGDVDDFMACRPAQARDKPVPQASWSGWPQFGCRSLREGKHHCCISVY